jgi:hypothetical protein
MKKTFTLLTAILVVFSTSCFANAIVTNIPIFKGGLNNNSYFQQGDSAIKYCQKKHGAIDKCLVNYAKKHNASKQAIEFMKLTSGYINKIDQHGNIAIITANVVAADHNQEIFIINKDGDFINPNTAASSQEIGNLLSKEPLFKALGKNGYHPMSFLQTDVAPQIKINTDGQQAVVFSYRLTNCMACENAGVANISYNFENNGKFKDISVINITADKNKS